MTAAGPFPPDCARLFQPVRRLAEGGFGTVWLAEQLELKRPAAVKLLTAGAGADPHAFQRFVNEARVTSTLLHPAIVRVYDHGADPGHPWIAYEYVNGPSLRSRLAAGPLPWRNAALAGAQVAAALATAHAAGVLHRDIKPENVLVGEAGQHKVADFGLARYAGDGVKTQAGLIMGTPAYLAPEVIRGASRARGWTSTRWGSWFTSSCAGARPSSTTSRSSCSRCTSRRHPNRSQTGTWRCRRSSPTW